MPRKPLMTHYHRLVLERQRTVSLFLNGGTLMNAFGFYHVRNDNLDKGLALLCIGLGFWGIGLMFCRRYAPHRKGLKTVLNIVIVLFVIVLSVLIRLLLLR